MKGSRGQGAKGSSEKPNLTINIKKVRYPEIHKMGFLESSTPGTLEPSFLGSCDD